MEIQKPIKFHCNSYNNLIYQLQVMIYFCIFAFVIVCIFLVTGCSSYYYLQTEKQNGNELLYYAEQYRNLSDVMNNKYIEQDFDSISRLLVEAVEIAQNVKELQADSEYKKAQNYLENWMYSDAYWFHLAISGGKSSEMNKVFDESMEYLTLFITEMERLGYTIK